MLVAQTVRELTGARANLDPLVMVVFAVLATVIAAVGYDWIHKSQRWVAYTMIAALLIFSVAALFRFDLPASHWDPGGSIEPPFWCSFSQLRLIS